MKIMINSYNNIMIDIKFSLPGHGSNLTFKNFHGNNQEQKINYHINSEISQADGWIVLENLKQETETCIVPKNNIIYLNNETSYKKNHYFDITPETTVAQLDNCLVNVLNNIKVTKLMGHGIASVFVKAHKWDCMKHGSSRWRKIEIVKTSCHIIKLALESIPKKL